MLPRLTRLYIVTFLVAGSGLAFLGVGAAFWGLLAGLALRAVQLRRA